jgi:hypothetical protein
MPGMGKGTVQSPDGSWLVTWSTFLARITYEVQDQKTGTVYHALWAPHGWLLQSSSPEEESIVVPPDDPDFESLLEALQGAYDAAS